MLESLKDISSSMVKMGETNDKMIYCCGLTTVFVLKFLIKILSYYNDPSKMLSRLIIYILANGRPVERF
jgi:hypothetical protein